MKAAEVQTPLCAPVHIMVDNWPFHAPVLVMADIFTPVFTNRSLYTPLSTVLRTSFRPSYAPLSTILRTSIDHLTHLYQPSYAPLSTTLCTSFDHLTHLYRPSYAPISTILRTSIDHLTHLYRPSYAPLSTIVRTSIDHLTHLYRPSLDLWKVRNSWLITTIILCLGKLTFGKNSGLMGEEAFSL